MDKKKFEKHFNLIDEAIKEYETMVEYLQPIIQIDKNRKWHQVTEYNFKGFIEVLEHLKANLEKTIKEI